MAEVTTTKLINLAQLTTEMGGIGLSAHTSDGTTTVHTEDVDQATLQAAIDAHVAIDVAANQRTVEEQLAHDMDAMASSKAALDTLIAKPNNTLTAADTKVIARELRTMTNVINRLCRTALSDYDSTE